MMRFTRRSLMSLAAGVLPGLAAFAGGGRIPAVAGPDGIGLSVEAIGAWLTSQDITLETLDRRDGGKGRITAELQQSFTEDPLIAAGGLLLPTGFCRFCLLAAQARVS